MTLKAVSAWLTAIVAIAVAVITIEDRYASAAEMKELDRDSKVVHLEMRLERNQDKLDGLVIIPEEERKEWQKREIQRLNSSIEKYVRRLGLFIEEDGE